MKILNKISTLSLLYYSSAFSILNLADIVISNKYMLSC